MNPSFNNRPRSGFQRGGRYQDQTRVNDRIRAPKVRVIDGVSGQQIGVLPTGQAIRMARERGLDLIEISAQADPPVCKIVDYGKYKYEQEKKKKEAAKSQKGSKLKEMKFRIGIDPHDYTIKIAHAEEFLAHGDKVRVQLQFKGRQMAHQELGFQLARRIRDDLQGMGHVDQEPKMAGRNINMQITPHPEKQRVRKYANFKHGKFINPEEEDNTHESDHDSEIAATAQADALQQNGNGNGGGNGSSPANGHETPAAEPAPSETTAETSRG
ncbi:MAG TPA: translation initiation factor IF-3 [Candidatus Saccharimonadia bacterium]|nr:translation initiation factor IF-3 [Candidatus Saccharimonadia bacterium]